MVAVPQFTNPSAAPARPLCAHPSRPAATILRFPCRHALIAVAADPSEGRAPFAPPIVSREIAASWALVLGLAIFGFVLF